MIIQHKAVGGVCETILIFDAMFTMIDPFEVEAKQFYRGAIKFAKEMGLMKVGKSFRCGKKAVCDSKRPYGGKEFDKFWDY